MDKQTVITPYFSSIRLVIAKAIMSAKVSIDIAVAWFTNEELFNCLLKRLADGIRIRLVIINDDINNNGGLDFQAFINEGGVLYFGKHGSFMHNKYCIVDDNLVCTGSYNYTYFAEHSNFENIVCIKNDKNAIDKFIKNYYSILRVSDNVTDIKKYLESHPYSINIQSSRQVRIRDLYQKAIEFKESDMDESEKIANSLTENEPQMDSFSIIDVLYKQWDKDICIRRIDVSQEETVIIVDINTSSSFFLYGTGLDKTWHLIANGDTIYASSITVTINDQLRLNRLASNTVYNFDESDSLSSKSSEAFQVESLTGAKTKLLHKIIKFRQPNNITCKIHFPKGDYIHSTISLFEGNKNNENDKHYWHALNISMQLNRIPTT